VTQYTVTVYTGNEINSRKAVHMYIFWQAFRQVNISYFIYLMIKVTKKDLYLYVAQTLKSADRFFSNHNDCSDLSD
jgi:hypothetical protein